MIKENLFERKTNLVDALFAFWSNKKSAIPADLFYQKMTTYGLVPDLKFIENVTNIMYQNRHKPV